MPASDSELKVAIVEDTKEKTRNKPINEKLKRVLREAGKAAGVDTVRVTSGGQPAKGTGREDERVGSTRHDLGDAADLQLIRDGRTLDFTASDDLPVIEAFVTAATAHGALGIGAAVGYMGPKTLHVGFGGKAVWGKGGKSANAPSWLRKAAEDGWRNPAPASGLFEVFARDGLNLRQGPGTGFPTIEVLPYGSLVDVVDRTDGSWWLIDWQRDGVADGHVHRAFLRAS